MKITNPKVLNALERADRQYKEGRAIPLESLKRELGFGSHAPKAWVVLE